MAYYLNDIGMCEDLIVGQDEGIEWMCSWGGKVFWWCLKVRICALKIILLEVWVPFYLAQVVDGAWISIGQCGGGDVMWG